MMLEQCQIDRQIEETLNSKRAQGGLFSNLWFHDVANRMKIRRQAEAKVMGLGDDYPVGTYPSHGGVIVNNNGGLWKGVALTALASTGIGAGLMAYSETELPPNKKTPVPSEHLYEIEILGDETGVHVESIKEID